MEFMQVLMTIALVFGRTVPVIVLTPFLGGRTVPTEVKMGLSIGVTILVFPLVKDSLTEPVPVAVIPFLALFLKEVFIGFVLGFINSHLFWAVEMTGRIIDTVRGSSMAEVLVPGSGTRATPFGNMFYNLLVVLFFAGGHRIFIEAYFFSFKKIPLTQMVDGGSGPLVEHILTITNEMFFIAVILAAPVIAATFITDVVFGILNRVAQQLNAYFMSMPVKAMAGIIMVLIALYPFVARLNDFIMWSLRSIETTLEFLAS